MSPEQLLLVAREYQRLHSAARVSNFAALAAASAAAHAHIDGIAVHASDLTAARALRTCLRAFPALSTGNEDFAELSARVFLRAREQPVD
ncbi:cell filamentation protein Fic [Corynebacterium sp. LK2590]|uniref:cell filamentation protein Fic n=1 Tax=unclassified Corynebacterium TaxID=2624378 RepID=UPI0034CD276E